MHDSAGCCKLCSLRCMPCQLDAGDIVLYSNITTVLPCQIPRGFVCFLDFDLRVSQRTWGYRALSGLRKTPCDVNEQARRRGESAFGVAQLLGRKRTAEQVNIQPWHAR